jgi:hypothetical protein
MTKDDIIRMAEEAAPYPFDEGLICFEHAELITFCNLVAAHERERLGIEYRKELDKLSVRNYELRKENQAIRQRSQS